MDWFGSPAASQCPSGSTTELLSLWTVRGPPGSLTSARGSPLQVFVFHEDSGQQVHAPDQLQRQQEELRVPDQQRRQGLPGTQMVTATREKVGTGEEEKGGS